MMTAQSLVAVLVGLQFAAFGWRINREISVGDQRRRTWLPIPDLMNIIALIGTVFFGVVLFLCRFETIWTNVELSVAYVLIAMHPVNEAAHYRLFSPKGRTVYEQSNRDYPLVTDQEAVTLIVTVLSAGAVAFYAYRRLVKLSA